MPLNLPNFRPLSASEAGGFGGFDLNAAIKSGLGNYKLYQQAKNEPAKLREALIAAQQANQIRQPYAENANRAFEADVGGKESNNALNPLRENLLRAQAQAALREKPIGGKISQLEQLRDRYPEGSSQYMKYDQALTNALQGSNGITLFDPQGNPMVQIGGSGGSKGKAGGQVYQNAQGNQFQVPNTAILTQLQNRVIGQKLVSPYIDVAIEKLPQFQSGWNKLGASIAGLSNKWAATDFQSPSDLASGNASLGLAAEGMLRQFGLNATGHKGHSH